MNNQWKNKIQDKNLENFLSCIKKMLYFIMTNILHKFKSDKKNKPLIYNRISSQMNSFMHGTLCKNFSCKNKHKYVNALCKECRNHECDKTCKVGAYYHLKNNYKAIIKYIKMYNKMIKQSGIINTKFNVTFESFIEGIEDTAKYDYYILILADIKINELLLYVSDETIKDEFIPILQGLLQYSEILIKKIKMTRSIYNSKNIAKSFEIMKKKYENNKVMMDFLLELEKNDFLQTIYQYDPIVELPKKTYKSSLFGRSEMVKLMLHESIDKNTELDTNKQYKQSVMDVTSQSIDELIDVFDKGNIKSINDIVGMNKNSNPMQFVNPRTKNALQKSQELLRNKVKKKEISTVQITDLITSVFNQQSKTMPPLDKSDPSYEAQKTMQEMLSGLNKIIKDKNLRQTGKLDPRKAQELKKLTSKFNFQKFM